MLRDIERRIHWRAACVLALALALAFTAIPAGAQEEKVDLKFEAFALNMSNIATGSNSTVLVNITRWSTDAERQSLFDTLVEQGQEKVVDALQKQEETGWFRSTGAMAAQNPFPSTRLRYARDFQQGDKRTIMLVTDRPIGGREAANSMRSKDYSVSIIQLDLEKDDKGKWKGDGHLAVGVALAYDKENKKLQVENYATEPIRLSAVTQSN